MVQFLGLACSGNTLRLAASLCGQPVGIISWEKRLNWSCSCKGVLGAVNGFMIQVSVCWITRTYVADMFELAVGKGTLGVWRPIPSEAYLAR